MTLLLITLWIVSVIVSFHLLQNVDRKEGDVSTFLMIMNLLIATIPISNLIFALVLTYDSKDNF